MFGSELVAQCEFDEIWGTALAQNEVWTQQHDVGRRQLPSALGRGQRQIVKLRSGFELWFDDAIYDRPIHLDYIYQIPQITLTFYVAGDFRIVNPGLQQEEDRSEVSGESCICYLPEIRSIEYYAAHQPLERVTLSIDLACLRSYSDWQAIPSRIQHLIAGHSIDPFHQTFGTQSHYYRPILHQMRSCPYQGAMRQMYLESKALELLTLQLFRWAQDEKPMAKPARWKSQDLEKLDRAREILKQSLPSPPTLMELARLVGLNDCKLKQGFRQVFGTTVFGCLRTYQMERAQQLLMETNISINDIADTVGYASLPAFSNAFSRHFGSSPRTFRQR